MSRTLKHTYLGRDVNIYIDNYCIWYRLEDVLTILKLDFTKVIKTFVVDMSIQYSEILALCFCTFEHSKKNAVMYENLNKYAKWYLYVPYRVVCRIIGFHSVEIEKYLNPVNVKEWFNMTNDLFIHRVKTVLMYSNIQLLKYKCYCLLNLIRAMNYFIHTEDFHNYAELNKIKRGLITDIFRCSSYVPINEYNNITRFIPPLMQGHEIQVPLICDYSHRHIHKSDSI